MAACLNFLELQRTCRAKNIRCWRVSLTTLSILSWSPSVTARAGFAINSTPQLPARRKPKAERRSLLAQLFGAETDAYVTAPFFCDYGYNIYLGRNAYFNVNCVLLDVMPIRIGANFLAGPGVHI